MSLQDQLVQAFISFLVRVRIGLRPIDLRALNHEGANFGLLTNFLHLNLVLDGTHIATYSFLVPKVRHKILHHNLTQLLGLLERNPMRTVQLPDHQIRQQPRLNRPID